MIVRLETSLIKCEIYNLIDTAVSSCVRASILIQSFFTNEYCKLSVMPILALAQKKYAVETFDGLCMPPPWLVENDKMGEKGNSQVFESNFDLPPTEHRCQVACST